MEDLIVRNASGDLPDLLDDLSPTAGIIMDDHFHQLSCL